MKINTRSIQSYIAISAFLLSGKNIFAPLFKSDSPITSLFFASVTGFLTVRIICIIYSKNTAKQSYQTFFKRITAISTAIFSVFSVLLLLTEVIKDTAYIAGRGVSLSYYISIGIITLCVAFYLCYNSEKGIFRFLLSICVIFFLLSLSLPFSFISTEQAIISKNFFTESDSITDSAIKGIISGLMISADLSVFLYLFKNSAKNSKSTLSRSVIYSSFATAFILLFSEYLCCLLLFGKALLFELDYPMYGAIKLFPFFDMTELLNCAKITSFTVKCAVYVYASADILRKAFSPQKDNLKTYLISLFSAIPILFIILISLSNRNNYGVFQHLIYPSVTLLSLSYLLIRIPISKK